MSAKLQSYTTCSQLDKALTLKPEFGICHKHNLKFYLFHSTIYLLTVGQITILAPPVLKRRKLEKNDNKSFKKGEPIFLLIPSGFSPQIRHI